MESSGFYFFIQLFWLLFILLLIVPIVQSQILNYGREKLLRKIELKNNSKVITMIHRQETRSLFGFFMMRMITIEDSEAVLRAIRMTPRDKQIDFIVHSPGGIALAATQIARALADHKGKVRVIVPHFAMSGGTLIALAADEIVMDPHAVLGPLDPQIGTEPASSIVAIEKIKDPKDIDDETFIKIDISKKALRQMYETVEEILLKKNYDKESARKIAKVLSQGKFTHDYPLTVEFLQSLGIKVSTEVDEEVYALMELYPQPAGIPTVQYIPEPIKRPEAVRK
ncbi:MAG: ATP-dependent Clp protease proteolytic subunit [Hydrogenothermaceae bacterium]|nr:ATP-dependent Clp protease proteolytic subunit [Hydrogenothermaceae bacterium]